MDLENEQSKDRQILFLEQEVEILREQLESLKQALLEEHQRAEDYREELTYTQLELNELNRELLNLVGLDVLQTGEAIKEDDIKDLNGEKSSRCSLDFPFQLYDSKALQANRQMRVELLMQLRSERSRLKIKSLDLMQNFEIFKTYSSEFIQTINARMRELPPPFFR